jgi:hypothetical protein
VVAVTTDLWGNETAPPRGLKRDFDAPPSTLDKITYVVALPLIWVASLAGWWEESEYRLWKWAGKQLGFVDTPTEVDE